MMEAVYEYNSLEAAPLKVEAVYRGGTFKNVKDDPLSILLPGVGNQGGFRAARKLSDSREFSYVVIYSSGAELEWPDYLDRETGIFRYYGDNRHPGSEIHQTKRGGNALLRDVFEKLHTGRQSEIPPFFLFEKTGRGRDVRFLGLAAPGNKHISPDRDLVSFWRTLDSRRFQNYEAYFTVLDLGEDVVSRQWIDALRRGDPDASRLAPACWKRFTEHGRDGIRPLQAPKIKKVPSKAEQLPHDKVGKALLKAITDHYAGNPYGFEACACEIARMADPHFEQFDLTRPWRDGGRDAVGKYRIGMPDNALHVECALEAKCYAHNNSVGVREMSRLISRIRYRQFGIMVTTSHVYSQAYGEVIEDGHPILVITGADIARVLVENGISPETIEDWLTQIDASH